MLSCYHFHVDDKYSEVRRHAVSLAQSTISMTFTERQVTNKKSEVIRAGKEMPQQLAIGLAIHQAIRHVRCIFVAFFPANFRLKDAGKVNRSIKDIPETRLLECADSPANP